MTTIVLLGGNGYIGRNVTKNWLKKDLSAEFYVLSRSGKNELKDSRIKNIAVDVTSVGAVEAVLPEKIDYIIDFIGRPEKDVDLFKKVNNLPAQVMLRVAEKTSCESNGVYWWCSRSEIVCKWEEADYRIFGKIRYSIRSG